MGSVKKMGANTSKAEEYIRGAKQAADEEDYEKAVELAKQSMIEVMRLKTEIEQSKSGKKAPAKKDGPTPGAPETSAPPPSQSTTAAEAPKAKPAATTSSSPQQQSGGGSGLPELIEGFSYIVEEERVNKCFVLMERQLEGENVPALCITRTNPKQLRKLYKFPEPNVKILWLTDREGGSSDVVSPSLENMIFTLEEFIDENPNSVVLLDGIEYLISNNTFNPVLRFIRKIVDKISETESILLVATSPEAIGVQEIKQLERELQPLKL